MGAPLESRITVSYSWATADAMADGLDVCLRAVFARCTDVSFRGVVMVMVDWLVGWLVGWLVDRDLSVCCIVLYCIVLYCIVLYCNAVVM